MHLYFSSYSVYPTLKLPSLHLRRLDKERENAAALAVLPDLLRELDASPARARLTALVEGVLAANIFDWGAQACVDLYQNGTILEIYRRAPPQGLNWACGASPIHWAVVRGVACQSEGGPVMPRACYIDHDLLMFFYTLHSVLMSVQRVC